MNSGLDAVIDGFPRFEALVRELSGTNPEFESLCHQYGEVTEALHGLEQTTDPDGESKANELKRRQCALADELHALMSANMRA